MLTAIIEAIQSLIAWVLRDALHRLALLAASLETLESEFDVIVLTRPQRPHLEAEFN